MLGLIFLLSCSATAPDAWREDAEACVESSDCETGHECVDGVCLVDDVCFDDEHCATGERCDVSTGECLPNNEEGICRPGETRCAGDNGLETCNEEGDAWLFSDCERGCLDGKCVVCLPGEISCEGEFVIACDKDGEKWLEVENCSSDGLICFEGECLACVPKSTRCVDGETLETCNEDGTSWERTVCDSGCVEGACIICEHDVCEYDLGWGGMCFVQTDCFECPECRLPYEEICVNEVCWLSGEQNPEDETQTLMGGFIVAVVLPRGVDFDTLRSASVRVFHPYRTDGSILTCGELLADPLASDSNEALNRLRVTEVSVNVSPGHDLIHVPVSGVPAGEDRMFLVRMHEQPRGEGWYPLAGCTDAVLATEELYQDITVVTEER